MANLTVENRFIDYFKPSTEIYQGMVEIDAKLGGTTPLNIIIDAPKSFLDKPVEVEVVKPVDAVGLASEEDDFFDEFDDEFDEGLKILSPLHTGSTRVVFVRFKPFKNP